MTEERIPRAGRHAELVVVVRLDDRAFPIHDVRDAAADVVPVEEVVVRVRVLLRLRLPLEPLARHNRARWVEDVLRLQHVLVHRREQQRRARVVEVRNDLVLHARHALPLRVVRIRRARRQRDHRVVRDACRGQPVRQIVAIVRGRRHARPRLHLLRLVPPRIVRIRRHRRPLLHPRQLVQVVVRIRLRRLRPLLPRQPVPHRVVRIRRGRPVVRRRDQAVAQVILVRPRLRRAAAVRLRHRFGQDVPVPVVRQVRLLAYRPRLPVHVRIRQLHRQAEVVVGVCQFGCQGAARQERRVVRELLDLPVCIVRIRADQLLVAPNQETADADKGEEQAKAIDR